MHYEHTGRTEFEVVERHDVDGCSSCGAELVYPNVQFGWLSCRCAGTVGHREMRCKACRTVNYDPPHDRDVPTLVGGSGYFGGDRAPHWEAPKRTETL